MRSDPVGRVTAWPDPPPTAPDPTATGVSSVSRTARAAALDQWLAGLIPQVRGVALVAVGGLGRRECLPHTDLDLVLVHTSTSRDRAVAERVASRLWYQVWDAGFSLDHAVRTVDAALETARTDVRTALGLLDARVVAGDAGLANRLRSAAAQQWRQQATHFVTLLRRACETRWHIHGELQSDFTGDLKEARGGFRDVVVLRGFEKAQIAPVDVWRPHVHAARRRLLDVREAAHRCARRRQDRLHPIIQPAVAAMLGLPGTAALRREVSAAAAAVAATLDEVWEWCDQWVAAGRTSRSALVLR